MKSKLKALSLFILSIGMVFTLISCGNTTNDDTANNSETAKAPTNQEYYDYLTSKYNYYFGDLAIDDTYNIYVDGYSYTGTYTEFAESFNDSYEELRAKLLDFKNDLETNIVKGNDEVDKYNAEVIKAIDKDIATIDDYTGTFVEKTKDYANLASDEIVDGFRSLTLDIHQSRVDLDNTINNAKATLGIS